MHATKYSIPFLNREQVACEVKLLLDGYVGGITTLKGAENPFIVSRQSQDSQLPYGILATESVIEFYTGGLVTLNDFYSESYTDWKIEFYYNGTLRFTHYLQIDNSSEAITDIDHVISLNGNDGLAQLQNLYLVESDGTFLYRNWTLAELLSYIFAFIPDLGIDAYLNIFENSTQDRNDIDYLTFLPQTAINTKYYQDSDGTSFPLYDILNNILTDFRSGLFQENGVWNIVRWGDLRIFPNGSIPGTRYTGFIGSYAAIEYPQEINIGRGLPIYPINENQISKPFRPFQYSKESFNYEQLEFITQNTLQIPDDAIPFSTFTIGDSRYDDYDLATYFLEWTQRNSDNSYLEIVTDTISNTETERYIVTPAGPTDDANRGIQFNAIPVTAGDSINFSLQFRTDNPGPDAWNFYIRFALVLPNDTVRVLQGSGTWSTAFDCIDFDTGSYLFVAGDTTTTDYQQWNLADVATIQAPVPNDGILVIQVNGTNTPLALEHPTTKWNEIQITIDPRVNGLATGHIHKNSQVPEIRNNEQFEVTHDDTLRNSIKGTLFTNAVTDFCSETGIGGVYFTRTLSWHRQDVTEERKLGDLNTFIDLFNQRIVRQIVEGDFFGFTELSMLSIINFTFAPNKKFIFGIATFNFMSCIWNGTLYELFDAEEEDGDLDNTYVFNYIYNNE